MADEQQNDPASPTSWLWREIEARFGKEAADELHRDHNAQLKLYARRQALDNYRRQLPGLERQLEQARREGKAVGALEKRIALRRERIEEADKGGKGYA